MDIDTNLVIQGGIMGTVGVLTAVKLITSYLKNLLDLHGRWVMILTLIISAYAVTTALLAVTYPFMSMVFMGIIGTVLVASTADAYFQQEQTQTQDREGVSDIKNVPTTPVEEPVQPAIDMSQV